MKFPPRSLCAYRPTLSIVTGERFDTLRVIGVGAFFLCAGFALIPLGTTVEALVVTVLVWTFGEMLTTLLPEGFVAHRSPVENRGQYMGLFSSAFSVAFVLAPLGRHLGVRAVWGSHLVGIVWLARRVLWAAFFMLSAAVRRQQTSLVQVLY